MKRLLLTIVLGCLSLQLSGQCYTNISSGEYFTLGLKSDGTLWGWGSDSSGQITSGTFSNVTTAYQMSPDTNWVYISAGHSSAFAIKSDGTLWACGSNTNGQLGDGTTTFKSTLTPNWDSNRLEQSNV